MKSVGIDIGGTQLRVAVFDENRKIVDVFKTNNDRALSAGQNMDKLLDFIMAGKEAYRGIGIGCPGPLNIKTGKILNPPNLVGWDNFEIVKYVEERTGICTVLNNDANVAGLAEAVLGAGAGYESVVFMGISTGIGGAYVYQGKLVNGAHSQAAEFWNMIVNDDKYHHKNANPGSLNEQSSGSGMERIATERFGRPMKPKELFALYYQRNELAVSIVEELADALAKGVANVTCTIDPDIIVIGGSVALHNVGFVGKVEEMARRYVLNPEYLKIELAQFGDDAGLLGASLLV